MADVEAATLEVWKATIDVQKHFNELSLRVRSIAVTVLAALLAAAGYALKEQRSVNFLGSEASLTGMILLAALVSWTAFFVMDRLWYHRLLRAAVAHGRKVESALSGRIPTVGLTETIDNGSPIWSLRAGHRLSIFYGFIAVVLWLGAGISLRAGPPYYVLGIVLLLLAFGLEFSVRPDGAVDKRRGFRRLCLFAGAVYFGWWALQWRFAASGLTTYLEWSAEAADKGDWRTSATWMQSANEADAAIQQSLVWGAVVPVAALITAALIYWLYRGFRPKLSPTSTATDVP